MSYRRISPCGSIVGFYHQGILVLGFISSRRHWSPLHKNILNVVQLKYYMGTLGEKSSRDGEQVREIIIPTHQVDPVLWNVDVGDLVICFGALYPAKSNVMVGNNSCFFLAGSSAEELRIRVPSADIRLEYMDSSDPVLRLKTTWDECSVGCPASMYISIDQNPF